MKNPLVYLHSSTDMSEVKDQSVDLLIGAEGLRILKPIVEKCDLL